MSHTITPASEEPQAGAGVIVLIWYTFRTEVQRDPWHVAARTEAEATSFAYLGQDGYVDPRTGGFVAFPSVGHPHLCLVAQGGV